MSYTAVDPIVGGESTAIFLDNSDGFLGYQDLDGHIKPVLANVGLFVNNLITDADGSGFLGVIDPTTGKEHWMQNGKDGPKVSFRGPQGEKGETGDKGDKGDKGLTIQGEFSDHPKRAIPQVPSKNVNDAYVLTQTWDATPGYRRGDVWVFNENGIPYYTFNCEGPQGEQGIQGEQGLQGEKGVDGITPHIGYNGNWFIGEEDTSVKAESTKIQVLSDSQINQYIELYGPEALTPDKFATFLKNFSDRFTADPSNPELSSVPNNIGTWAYNCKLQYPNSFILDKDLFTIELNGTNLVSIQYKQVIPSFEVRSGWLISSLNGNEEHLGIIQGPQGATGAKGKDGHTPYLSVQEYKPGILALMSDGEFITNEIGEVFPVYCDTLSYPEHVSESSWFNESKPHNTLVKWCGENPLILDSGETFDPGHVYRYVKAGNVVKALTLYGKGLDPEYPSEWMEFPIEEVNLLKLRWELLSISYTYDQSKLIFSPFGSYVEVYMEDDKLDIEEAAPLLKQVFTENEEVNYFMGENRTSGWMVGYKEFICGDDMWVLEEYNNEVPESFKTFNLVVRMSKDSNESLENSTEL